tara:strand:- start:5598 stop:6848 length:1251 start_codon:yes stop_codon:yes gene_type:complete
MDDDELKKRLERINTVRQQRTEQMRRYREKRKNDPEKVLKDKENKSIYMKRYRDKQKELDAIAIKTANERNDIIVNCNKNKDSSFTSDMIVNNINDYSDIPVPNHIKTGIKGLKTNTAKSYANKICLIHKKKFEKELDVDILYKIFTNNYNSDNEKYIIENLSYLKEYEQIIDIVNTFYTSLNSQYSYIVPFLTLISYIEQLYKVSYNDLALYLRELRDKIEKQRGDNEIKEGKVLIKNFDIDVILENITKLDSSIDKLIYALYTIHPPRRLLDYSEMFISNNIDIDKLDDSKNYVICENDIPSYFLFNKYKTNKFFGKQKIKINNNLSLIIQEFIKINKLNYNDSLLNNIKSNTLGKYITNISKKIYNFSITETGLRNSYITYINNKKLTLNEKKTISQMMAHSLTEQQKYNKVV